MIIIINTYFESGMTAVARSVTGPNKIVMFSGFIFNFLQFHIHFLFLSIMIIVIVVTIMIVFVVDFRMEQGEQAGLNRVLIRRFFIFVSLLLLFLSF